MTQTTYRILPQSVTLYGVEMTEPDKAPRVLLTCSTQAAADTWISEIKRLRSVPIRMDNRHLQAAIGAEPHTPLGLAVRDTLIGIGCLAKDRAD
jgi:hypothetical protein